MDGRKSWGLSYAGYSLLGYILCFESLLNSLFLLAMSSTEVEGFDGLFPYGEEVVKQVILQA